MVGASANVHKIYTKGAIIIMYHIGNINPMGKIIWSLSIVVLPFGEQCFSSNVLTFS